MYILAMMRLFIFLMIVLTKTCCSRDALKYFVEHRQVYNSSFIVLTNMNTSNTVWVEYEYYFENIKGKNPSTQSFIEVLTVGVFENLNAPFDCEVLYENNTEEKLKGYSFEILNLLQDNLNFEVNYIWLNYAPPEQNLTELLSTKGIDLIACHPEINYKIETDVTQLHPTLKSNNVLIYKPSKLHFTKDIFILTFAGTLWLCFLILLIILAFCLHISTKRYLNIYSYDSWSWVDITLWANAAACQQGLSHTPSGFASRSFFFLGYLISYLLYTGFAAGITSLLLQQYMNNEITLADVQKMKLRVVTLTEMHFLYKNRSLIVDDLSHLFKYIDQENTVGIAPKIYVEQYFARNFNENLINTYATSLITENQHVRGFTVLKNNVYNHMLNEGLLALQESGLLMNVLKRSLLPLPANTATSNYSSAGIEHVGSAIIILVVGSVSSAVFLVAELLIALYKSRCKRGSKNDGGYFDNQVII